LVPPRSFLYARKEITKKIIVDSQFNNLKVYPINNVTAWGFGDYDIVINVNAYKSKFYDSLIKTDEGWRVIMSVVVPVKEKGKQ